MPTAVEYAIEIPLEGEERWFELCAITTPEGVAEVLRSLLAHDRGKLYLLRVRVRPAG